MNEGKGRTGSIIPSELLTVHRIMWTTLSLKDVSASRVHFPIPYSVVATIYVKPANLHQPMHV